MKRFLFPGIAIAVLLLWKFVIAPSGFLETQSAIGAGWEDARADFMSQYVETFTEEFTPFQLPAQAIERIAECTTDKSIEFLSTTDCSYLYNESTTTEAEHLLAQEECFIENDYEIKEEEFSIACMKIHFPDDWKHVKFLIQEMFEAQYTAIGVGAEQAGILAACMAGQTIAVVQKRGCPLINAQAQRAEQLLFTVDDCIGDPDNDPEYQAALASCQSEQESPAASTDGA